MTSGVAIVVLVPLLAQTVAATEHLLARQFPAWLSRFTVAQTDEFRQKVLRYWREQLLVLGGLAVVAGAGVIVGAPRLGATFPILADLARHPGLLAACTVGYLFLGIGLFCSQLLFSLVRSDATSGGGVGRPGGAGRDVDRRGVGRADRLRRRRARGRGRRLRVVAVVLAAPGLRPGRPDLLPDALRARASTMVVQLSPASNAGPTSTPDRVTTAAYDPAVGRGHAPICGASRSPSGPSSSCSSRSR